MASAAVAPADEQNPVVVELFTSQGCSSCPPADALLAELATRDDVIPLALHVDYWDYLGWKDTMGDAAFTARQKRYAHAAGSRSIYTPQMIVAGVTHVIGYRPMQVADAISTAVAADPGVELSLVMRGGRLEISAKPEPGLPRDIMVQIVRYIPTYDVSIRRGENAGRDMTYVNTVSAWDIVGNWNGRQPLNMRVQISGTSPIVVILQAAGPGRVLAAARLR